MDLDPRGAAGLPGKPRPSGVADAGAVRNAVQAAVTAVYEAHALGLTRLAHVMLGDKAAAEALIVTGTQPGATAGVLRQGRYTPIPWSNRTAAAAW